MKQFIIVSTINNEEVYVAKNNIMDSYEWVENKDYAYCFENNEEYDQVIASGLLKDEKLDGKLRIEVV